MKPSHPGQMQTSSPQELGTTGWETRGGLLGEVSWFEISPVVISIEKSVSNVNEKGRANLFWSVLRLLETDSKPLALLSAAGPRSRPAQDSQARPRRLFQCTELEGWGATSRRKLWYGALWVLRFTVRDRRKKESGIFLTEKGEGSYGTWAVQNVERTFEEISIWALIYCVKSKISLSQTNGSDSPALMCNGFNVTHWRDWPYWSYLTTTFSILELHDNLI